MRHSTASNTADAAFSTTTMTQLGLFASTPLQLAADAEGGIVYRPALIDVATAAHWYERLCEQILWTQERRLMYERDVDVPRLVAHCSVQDPGLPAVLKEAVALVRGAVPAPFTSIGLNWYRDGRDSVAPHNDRLAELVPGQPIALLSLGATRRMTIRAKAPPRRVMHVELEPGSLLVMSHASQRVYDHGIPKQAGPIGGRISLAFRVRP